MRLRNICLRSGFRTLHWHDTDIAQGRTIKATWLIGELYQFFDLPRYALKSVKYFRQSVELNSGGFRGPRSAVYFRSRTGENETDLGDAERVRTDAIPLHQGIKGGADQIHGQSWLHRGWE